jgi:hypothetical protein
MTTVLDLLQTEVKKQYKKIISPKLEAIPTTSQIKDKIRDFVLTASPDNGFKGKDLSKNVITFRRRETK